MHLLLFLAQEPFGYSPAPGLGPLEYPVINVSLALWHHQAVSRGAAGPDQYQSRTSCGDIHQWSGNLCTDDPIESLCELPVLSSYLLRKVNYPTFLLRLLRDVKGVYTLVDGPFSDFSGLLLVAVLVLFV